ncbi:MAG: restriction endonuclease subunit S [Gemmatimonadaceae bacterium]
MNDSWPTVQLAKLCEVFTDGDWVESKDQSSEGIRLVQTGNVGEGVFKDRGEKARHISETTFKRLRCTEIFEGDSLISRLPDPIGRSCIVPDTGKRMITAVDCTIVRFDRSRLLPEFFDLYCRTPEYLQAVDAEATGTTRKRISREKLGKVPIPVPPLSEQTRIVETMTDALESIAGAQATAQKNLENARSILKSHTHALFRRRGEGWVEKTINQVSINLDSRRIPITRNMRKAGKYPYYGASGIVDRVADYIFDCDALLVSEDGANLLMRATPIAFSVSGKYWVNNHAHILKFENIATQRFVEFYLETIQIDQYIRGAAQPKLTQKALNSIPIPIPESLAAQVTLVESIESLSHKTRRLEALYETKLAALGALKKSLLHRAFTGQL